MDEIKDPKDVFVVRRLNEGGKFIITIGEHLATRKQFNSLEQAERYIEFPKWDTMLALMWELKEVENKQNTEENGNKETDR